MTVFDEPIRFTGYRWETLPQEMERRLDDAAATCCGLAVSMVARANSGHPAGSLSSMKLYLAAYGASNLTPDNADQFLRDHVVISHGHTSPAAYAALAYYGFVDALEALAGFRRTGSIFQGHVERLVPGIDWGSGCLGQGLSAGAGFALAQRALGYDGQVLVVMGDGEQSKGQVAEARRLIAAQGLKNVTALIDLNGIQISGTTDEVLPVRIAEIWAADGWTVIHCDGHSFASLYSALKEARQAPAPAVLLCRTVMGKGVSFMENRPDYHGKAATGDLYRQAMVELGQPDFLSLAQEASPTQPQGRPLDPPRPFLETGSPRAYQATEKTDNRSAFGKALADVGALNYQEPGRTPLLVFDCDLAGSVKTDGFAKACPQWFVQGGIQEHNTATAAGAASVAGTVVLWADFGVFGLAEAYNQQRMNDVNRSNLKLALTHVGLDVGEDGMTHQCIDYVALTSNFFNWKLVVPLDPNQTDRATRWALAEPGNVCLAMGRSKVSVICDGSGLPLCAEPFSYGRALKVKEGGHGAILALGSMTQRALAAAQVLKDQGIDVAVYGVSCPLEVAHRALAEAASTGAVITMEDHHVRTGMGAIWTARAAELGLKARYLRLGVDRYGASGPSEEVYAAMGLDALSVARRVAEFLK